MKTYLSHYIRGLKGEEATEEDIEKNCAGAIDYAKGFRYKYPNVDLYVPAESEPFVGACLQMKYLDIDQILDVDCKIIRTCDIVIVHNPEILLSHGMITELNFAVQRGIPIVGYNAYKDLDRLLKE